MSRHSHVWAQSWGAQTRVGTNVCGHKRVRAQTCVGTVVWAQSCMVTNVVEPGNGTASYSGRGVNKRLLSGPVLNILSRATYHTKLKTLCLL